MTESILNLKARIEDIKNSSGIKLPPNKFVNVGLLLENLLGLEINSFPVADIDGIELKVSKKDSIYPITLFSCTCDGPDFFELNRLVNEYGARDQIYRETKILYVDLVCTKYTNWGKNLKMKLHVDYRKNKVYIIVAHTNGKIIEKRAYWNFSTLEQLLEQKLKVLCLCSYVIMYRNRERYCKFEDYSFLKYLGFSFFLGLLENGYIHVSIKYGIYKSGKKKGLSYNHGTSFFIKKNALYMLFEHF